MLYRSAVTLALTASLINGHSVNPRSYASSPATTGYGRTPTTTSTYTSSPPTSVGNDEASYTETETGDVTKPEDPETGYVTKPEYISNKSKVVSTFATCQADVVKYGSVFDKSVQSQSTQDIISGLVDLRTSILSLSAQVNVGVGNVGVGIWIGADLNVFANLYVSLLVKLQVALNIIQSGGQVDACKSSIVALEAPLKALVSVFVNAGINLRGLIGAQVDLSLFASVGISLGLSVDVGATVGTGSLSGYTNNKSKVVTTFATCQANVVKYGPVFETSLKSRNIKSVIRGLVDIRASILSLSAQVNVGVGNVGVGIWVGADLNIFANLYVSLLAKIQVVLKIIRSHGQVDACQSSIVALNAPLKALGQVFINAGINVGGLIGAQVDLNLFVSVGISLGISANVEVGTGFGAIPRLGSF